MAELVRHVAQLQQDRDSDDEVVVQKLRPHVFGPYYLELCDPDHRLLLEWDRSWELYPRWVQRDAEDFVKRKQRYLKMEGWQVLRIPLQEYRQLLPGRSDSADDDDGALKARQREWLGLLLEQNVGSKQPGSGGQHCGDVRAKGAKAEAEAEAVLGSQQHVRASEDNYGEPGENDDLQMKRRSIKMSSACSGCRRSVRA